MPVGFRGCSGMLRGVFERFRNESRWFGGLGAFLGVSVSFGELSGVVLEPPELHCSFWGLQGIS